MAKTLQKLHLTGATLAAYGEGAGLLLKVRVVKDHDHGRLPSLGVIEGLSCVIGLLGR